MEDKYPAVLTFDCPETGIEVVVVCTGKHHLQIELDRMFDRCGYGVPYAID